MQAKSKMAAKVSLPANALSNRFCLHSRFHSNRESEKRPEVTYRQNEGIKSWIAIGDES